jgi:hypothetical protein
LRSVSNWSQIHFKNDPRLILERAFDLHEFAFCFLNHPIHFHELFLAVWAPFFLPPSNVGLGLSDSECENGLWLDLFSARWAFVLKAFLCDIKVAKTLGDPDFVRFVCIG